MRNGTKWSGVVAAALLASGCSLTIDPESVPPPAASCVPVCTASLICGVTANNCGTTCAAGSGCTPACVPVCTSAQICGVTINNCGATCAAGSGCTPAATTHTLQGRLTPGAGSASAAGGHAVSQGTLSGGAGGAAAPSGHSISQGTLSP